MGVGGTVAPTEEDTSAWEPPLVDAYQRGYLGLVRLAYLITGSRDAAPDIVQDAFISARRSWDRVRDPEPYIRAIVINGCRAWARRRRLERSHARADERVDQLAADELWDALDSLQPRPRTAIVLRYYAGLPDDEIARLIGCRPSTVRSVIHRALRQLRREIGQ
jgi:RNA polymerase sigma factor (sigma-70 family)